MPHLLLDFLLISFLALATYCTVCFIDICFNDQNILDWYYKWLLESVEPRNVKLAKIMGMCPVCYGFWVGLVLYCVYAYCFNLPIVGFIPYISISQYLLISRFLDE